MVGTTEAGTKALRPVAVRVEKVRIDTELAREWLDSMVANRNVSRRNLDTMMRAMMEERWHYDGSPIKFNSRGELIDGQHRLWAVINTGLAQDFLVVWGVDDAAMNTLDTGKSRSLGDVLKIHDPTLTDVNNAAATLGIVVRWTNGERNNGLRTTVISNDEAVRFFDEHKEDVVVAGRHGRRLARAVGAGSVQAFSLCYWLFAGIEVEDAEFFWDRLIDGQGLEIGNPIYALREMLIREARMADTRQQLRSDVAAALVIKAWNAYRKGEEIKLLHFKTGGAHPERYPEPV